MAAKRSTMKNRTSTAAKRPSRGSGTKAREEAAPSLSSIAGSIGSLLTNAMGNRLNDVLVDLKDRVGTMVAEDGPKVLEDAKTKVKKAADDLFEWGKEHPVKTAAAAAALLAASTFIYATISSSSQATPKRKSA